MRIAFSLPCLSIKEGKVTLCLSVTDFVPSCGKADHQSRENTWYSVSTKLQVDSRHRPGRLTSWSPCKPVQALVTNITSVGACVRSHELGKGGYILDQLPWVSSSLSLQANWYLRSPWDSQVIYIYIYRSLLQSQFRVSLKRVLGK